MSAGNAPASSSRWLFGPVPDLVLGCGLGYAAIFVVMVAWGPRLSELVPLGMMPLLLLLTGTPHYGATLLRVYEERHSRRRYAFFTVWVSALLALSFVASLQWYVLGSLLLTLYFNWNPWHYAGQNYGLALMFLHRRDVTVTAQAKRLLHLSFVLSFVLACIEMNGASRGALYGPLAAETGAKVIGPAFHFIPLGIPRDLQRWLLGIGLVAYLGCVGGAFASFKRGNRWRDLAPSLLLVASQSLWFVAPATLRLWGATAGLVPFAVKYNLYAFMWVAVGHAVQYLWVTSYYAKREGRRGREGTYYLKCVLAGAALWHVPALLFAPGFFGSVAYSDGLRLLVAAVVNLHHFILDGAIWKLRDGAVANLLLRSPEPDRPEPIDGRPARSWLRPAVWTAGTLGVCLGLVGTWEREMGVRRAADRGDAARIELAARRLSWVGQQDAAVHDALAEIALRRGREERALSEMDKSLSIKPHPLVHFRKGQIYAKRSQWNRAVDEYEAAYAIDPYPPKLVTQLAFALLEAGHPARATQVLRAGLTNHPNDPNLTRLLHRAQRPANSDT